MITDPVCGTEIEEIDVPESLRSKREGKIYYFCSHECRSEFELFVIGAQRSSGRMEYGFRVAQPSTRQ
jgi:YHS domain-containing protein